MAIILGGGELDVFTPISANAVEVTTASTFNAAFARCSIRPGFTTFGAGTGIRSQNFTAINNSWLHFDYYKIADAAVNTQMFAFLNASSQIVFRILQTAANTFQCSYWNGSVFVNVGVTFTLANTILTPFDLNYNPGAGTFALYANKLLVTSGVGITAAAQNPIFFEFSSCGLGSNGNFVSQIIFANEDTRSMNCVTIPATGNGANTAWTGVFTDINEIVLNDATFIESATASQSESFTIATPSLTGATIKAVCIGSRSSRAATGPQNIEALIRLAGTNYFSAPFNPDVVLLGRVTTFNTNPATAAPWAVSDITAANFEYGARSAV